MRIVNTNVQHSNVFKGALLIYYEKNINNKDYLVHLDCILGILHICVFRLPYNMHKQCD